ncbi:hypothetical protein EVAR_90490_1 [Eumeta japonica]|uniref:Uncharacterized protein n=1 Tax=Eumeta variegata TaxID=151549 RepID=A0A4C2AAJ2_EUMVA|nr:hypothetical protein EVAR_90490_1 [Eumeta japonica]
MPESRVTSVQTNSPGAPPSPKTAADYDRFPLSYAKKVIRAASLEEWQQRYAEEALVISLSASFPEWKKRTGSLATRNDVPWRRHLQVMVGSRSTCLGLAAGLTYCACDPVKIQDVLHVLGTVICSFGRAALKQKWCRGLEAALPEILDDARKKKNF